MCQNFVVIWCTVLELHQLEFFIGVELRPKSRLGPVINSSPLVPYMYASVNWVIISSGNGLSPIRYQAITWTNAGLLSIGLLEMNFSEIWIWILSFPFKKMHLNMSSAKTAAILSRGRWVNWCHRNPPVRLPVLQRRYKDLTTWQTGII